MHNDIKNSTKNIRDTMKHLKQKMNETPHNIIHAIKQNNIVLSTQIVFE